MHCIRYFSKHQGRSGNRASRFFFPEGRTYSPPAKRAVVSLPLVRLVRSSRTVFQSVLQRGQEMPQAGIPCAVGASADAEIAAYRTNPADALPASCLRKPVTDSFIADMDGFTPPIFFLRKRNKNEGERTVRTNGNLPLGSKGCEPGKRTLRCGGIRLSELFQYSQ